LWSKGGHRRIREKRKKYFNEEINIHFGAGKRSCKLADGRNLHATHEEKDAAVVIFGLVQTMRRGLRDKGQIDSGKGCHLGKENDENQTTRPCQ